MLFLLFLYSTAVGFYVVLIEIRLIDELLPLVEIRDDIEQKLKQLDLDHHCIEKLKVEKISLEDQLRSIGFEVESSAAVTLLEREDVHHEEGARQKRRRADVDNSSAQRSKTLRSAQPSEPVVGNVAKRRK